MTRKLELRVHDTSIGIWQDDPNDPTFSEEVYGGLIRLLRSRGWSVKADPDIKKNHPILNDQHRLASKGTLRAEIAVHGRSIEMKVWATTWPINNRNGRRYDFNKFDRMDYLDQKRFVIEVRTVTDWLSTIASVTVSNSGTRGLTADERIAKSYAESWHCDKALGRPVCRCDSNRKSRDGALLEHGQTVWFVGRDGRIRRGQAFVNINNMWWVKVSHFELTNIACFELFTRPPENLRRKRNERARRAKLEGLLSRAVHASDFRRAEQLHRILFADQPVYRIWSRKWDAYYAANRSGYSGDAVNAGRYTREEAEAEVRRVPHILSMVTPEGEHIRFDQAEAAA